MKTVKLNFVLNVLSLLVLADATTIAAPVGTAFSYQGRLATGTNPASGFFDLEIRLYDALSGGGLVAGPVTNTLISVNNGLFTVALDFGPNVFDGSARWLEVGVRTNGSGLFSTLSPRQPITPTPYAITASNLSGTLPAAQLSGTISSAQLGGTYGAAVTFSNTANAFTGNGTGLTGVNASTLGGLGAASFWKVLGNGGTTAGTNFLGTIDNQPLELKVNGQRAFRLEPTTNSPNLIGGFSGNFVSNAVGVTISGGGALGAPNSVTPYESFPVPADHAAIGGGKGNFIVNGPYATIGGGNGNKIDYAGQGDAPAGTTIGGGQGNSIGDSRFATIGGGSSNTVRYATGGANYETIAGGSGNIIEDSSESTIGGGHGNFMDFHSELGTIGGGEANRLSILANHATIGGGRGNIIYADEATIAGGANNKIDGEYGFGRARSAAIGGGTGNVIEFRGAGATISGGSGNRVSGQGPTDNPVNASIGGGQSNLIASQYGTISGGLSNTVSGAYSSISGGDLNLAEGDYSTVSGGAQNAIVSAHPTYEGSQSSIGGGYNNTILACSFSTIAGGGGNLLLNGLWGDYATIGGGGGNRLDAGAYATIAGGAGNSMNFCPYSTIGGGQSNSLDASFQSVIGGGLANVIAGYGCTVSGGGMNVIEGPEPGPAYSTVGGGWSNKILVASYSTIGGGNANSMAFGVYSTIAGGISNTINASQGSIGGGQGNLVSGSYGVVPGGEGNLAVDYAFAAGHRARAMNPGAFVWAAGNSNDYPSRVDNRVHMYAAGGLEVAYGGQTNDGSGNRWIVLASSFTNRVINVYNEAYLSTGGNWTDSSDRNAKTNFTPIVPSEILDRVANLPLTRWNYRSEDASVPHLGPVAQDFRAAFGLGADDKHIAALDSSGVALAAIQGLNQKLEQALGSKQAEIQTLRSQNRSLEQRLEALEKSWKDSQMNRNTRENP